MSQARHLLRDIDTMVTARNPAECGRLFQRLANLYQDFSLKADQDQLAVFDDVFVRLLPGCDHDTLLSQTLSWARSGFAPKQTLMRLALHSSLEFSIPVLVHAQSFDEQDLLLIARQANEAQQLVLATRARLPALACDHLIAFGSDAVRAVLSANPTARMSRTGSKLLEDACGHEAGQSVPSVASLVLQTRLAMVAVVAPDQPFESTVTDLIRHQNWPELLAVLASKTGLSAGAMVRALLGPDIQPLLQLARAMDWAWPVVETLLGVRMTLLKAEGGAAGDPAGVEQAYHAIERQQACMTHDFLVRRSRQTDD